MQRYTVGASSGLSLEGGNWRQRPDQLFQAAIAKLSLSDDVAINKHETVTATVAAVAWPCRHCCTLLTRPFLITCMANAIIVQHLRTGNRCVSTAWFPLRPPMVVACTCTFEHTSRMQAWSQTPCPVICRTNGARPQTSHGLQNALTDMWSVTRAQSVTQSCTCKGRPAALFLRRGCDRACTC